MRLLLVLIAKILFACGVAELLLFVLGYRTNSPRDLVPGAFTVDSELGWRHSPSTRNYQAANGSGPVFTVTFREDGSRAVSNDEHLSGPEIILLGCSFTEGYGLSDSQTFAWKLQSLLPARFVKNFGTAGYGTLQSYFLERRYLDAHRDRPPAAIVYHFASFHLARNIKNPATQRYWVQPGIFPYCDLEGCSTWSGKPMGPLSHWSRFYSLAENVADGLRLAWQQTDAEQIALKLVKDMKELATERGTRFYAAPVDQDGHHWTELFRQEGIEVLDCDSPMLHEQGFRLSDGHPNERWTEEFSKCLAPKLP